jgi:hypothetical protein
MRHKRYEEVRGQRDREGIWKRRYEEIRGGTRIERARRDVEEGARVYENRRSEKGSGREIRG